MILTPDWFASSRTMEEIATSTTSDPYIDSTFLPLKILSSKVKGKYFEHMVEEALTDAGHQVEKPLSSDHDRLVDGWKAEIKGSFLWGEGGGFRWQQIRPAEDYDFVIAVAVSPDLVEMFGLDKEASTAYLTAQDDEGFYRHNQHGGKRSNSGTYFLQGYPEDFDFMIPLDEFLDSLR